MAFRLAHQISCNLQKSELYRNTSIALSPLNRSLSVNGVSLKDESEDKAPKTSIRRSLSGCHTYVQSRSYSQPPPLTKTTLAKEAYRSHSQNAANSTSNPTKRHFASDTQKRDKIRPSSDVTKCHNARPTFVQAWTPKPFTPKRNITVSSEVKAAPVEILKEEEAKPDIPEEPKVVYKLKQYCRNTGPKKFTMMSTEPTTPQSKWQPKKLQAYCDPGTLTLTLPHYEEAMPKKREISLRKLKKEAKDKYSRAVKSRQRKEEVPTTQQYELEDSKPRQPRDPEKKFDIFAVNKQTRLGIPQHLQPSCIPPYGQITNVISEKDNNKRMHAQFSNRVKDLMDEAANTFIVDDAEAYPINYQQNPAQTMQISRDYSTIANTKERSIGQRISGINALIARAKTKENQKVALKRISKTANSGNFVEKCQDIIDRHRNLNPHHKPNAKALVSGSIEERETLAEALHFATNYKRKFLSRSNSPAAPLTRKAPLCSASAAALSSPVPPKEDQPPEVDFLAEKSTDVDTSKKISTTSMKLVAGPKINLLQTSAMPESSEITDDFKLGKNEKMTVPWPSYSERFRPKPKCLVTYPETREVKDNEVKPTVALMPSMVGGFAKREYSTSEKKQVAYKPRKSVVDSSESKELSVDNGLVEEEGSVGEVALGDPIVAWNAARECTRIDNLVLTKTVIKRLPSLLPPPRRSLSTTALNQLPLSKSQLNFSKNGSQDDWHAVKVSGDHGVDVRALGTVNPKKNTSKLYAQEKRYLSTMARTKFPLSESNEESCNYAKNATSCWVNPFKTTFEDDFQESNGKFSGRVPEEDGPKFLSPLVPKYDKANCPFAQFLRRSYSTLSRSYCTGKSAPKKDAPAKKKVDHLTKNKIPSVYYKPMPPDGICEFEKVTVVKKKKPDWEICEAKYKPPDRWPRKKFYGHIGPEGTLGVKLRRLKKFKYDDPKRVCPEECDPCKRTKTKAATKEAIKPSKKNKLKDVQKSDKTFNRKFSFLATGAKSFFHHNQSGKKVLANSSYRNLHTLRTPFIGKKSENFKKFIKEFYFTMLNQGYEPLIRRNLKHKRKYCTFSKGASNFYNSPIPQTMISNFPQRPIESKLKKSKENYVCYLCGNLNCKIHGMLGEEMLSEDICEEKENLSSRKEKQISEFQEERKQKKQKKDKTGDFENFTEIMCTTANLEENFDRPATSLDWDSNPKEKSLKNFNFKNYNANLSNFNVFENVLNMFAVNLKSDETNPANLKNSNVANSILSNINHNSNAHTFNNDNTLTSFESNATSDLTNSTNQNAISTSRPKSPTIFGTLLQRNISMTTTLNQGLDEKKCKKLGVSKAKPKCPKLKPYPECPPLPPSIRCDKKRVVADVQCVKQNAPYRSFAECKEPDPDEWPTECLIDKTKHLQPKNPILNSIVVMKPPPPFQGPIDPTLEENCVLAKLGLDRPDTTKNCMTFHKPYKPIRAKELLAAHEEEQRKIAEAAGTTLEELEEKARQIASKMNKSKTGQPPLCPVVDLKTCNIDPMSLIENKDCEEKKDPCAKKASSKDDCEVKKPPKKKKSHSGICPEKEERIQCPVEKSLWEKIVDFFKARPGCPSPDEWKKKRLREAAEKAAEAAGLALCPKKKCVPKKKVCKPKKDICDKPKKEEKEDPPPWANKKCPKVPTKCSGGKAPAPAAEKKVGKSPDCPPKKAEKKKKKDVCEDDKKPKEEPAVNKLGEASAYLTCKPEDKKKEECVVKEDPCKPKEDPCKPKEDPCKPKKKDECAPGEGESKAKTKDAQKGETKKDGKKGETGLMDVREYACQEPVCEVAEVVKKEPMIGDIVCDKEKKEPVEETCEEMPEKSEGGMVKGGKCPRFKLSNCPPRARWSCDDFSQKKKKKCKAPIAPYPSFSECMDTWPPLTSNECTEQARRKRDIKYEPPEKGDKKGQQEKCYSTYSRYRAPVESDKKSDSKVNPEIIAQQISQEQEKENLSRARKKEEIVSKSNKDSRLVNSLSASSCRSLKNEAKTFSPRSKNDGDSFFGVGASEKKKFNNNLKTSKNTSKRRGGSLGFEDLKPSATIEVKTNETKYYKPLNPRMRSSYDRNSEVKSERVVEVKSQRVDVQSKNLFGVKSEKLVEVKSEKLVEVKSQGVKSEKVVDAKTVKDVDVISEKSIEVRSNCGTEVKSDCGTEVKSDCGTEVKSDGGTEVKSDRGIEVKSDRGIEVKVVDTKSGIQVKSTKNVEVKLDKPVEIKQQNSAGYVEVKVLNKRVEVNEGTEVNSISKTIAKGVEVENIKGNETNEVNSTEANGIEANVHKSEPFNLNANIETNKSDDDVKNLNCEGLKCGNQRNEAGVEVKEVINDPKDSKAEIVFATSENSKKQLKTAAVKSKPKSDEPKISNMNEVKVSLKKLSKISSNNNNNVDNVLMNCSRAVENNALAYKDYVMEFSGDKINHSRTTGNKKSDGKVLEQEKKKKQSSCDNKSTSKSCCDNNLTSCKKNNVIGSKNEECKSYDDAKEGRIEEPQGQSTAQATRQGNQQSKEKNQELDCSQQDKAPEKVSKTREESKDRRQQDHETERKRRLRLW